MCLFHPVCDRIHIKHNVFELPLIIVQFLFFLLSYNFNTFEFLVIKSIMLKIGGGPGCVYG